MTNRSNHLASYTFLVGLLILSFSFNVHFYNRLRKLEFDSVLWRCGTSQIEFQQIQNEIDRLENNPFFNACDPPSVLKKGTGE
jgi:hypothetical protein